MLVSQCGERLVCKCLGSVWIGFSDDGRGVARVDWDFDGDMDFWIANRSAPQVRFVRNDIAAENGYLALRLQGNQGNRDAIGARVSVRLQGESSAQSKTLRAGDGFLSQSSKWLHFGLGKNALIDRVEVRWPGGDAPTEVFEGVEPNRFHLLQEGVGTARQWDRTSLGDRLDWKQESEFERPAARTAAILSPSKFGLPEIRGMGYDGKPLPLVGGGQGMHRGPVLLNLWASWCAPCVGELRELAQKESVIKEAGLSVMSLSTDKIGGSNDSSAATAVLQKIGFPYHSGSATREVIERLQFVHNAMFDIYSDLPLPISFLVDGHGDLIAVYKGAADTDRILKDLGESGRPLSQLRDANIPFDGTWLSRPRKLSFFPIAEQLLASGDVEAAATYCLRYEKMFASHPRWVSLQAGVGNAFAARNQYEQGMRWLEKAVSGGGNVSAYRGLAWMHATCADQRFRKGNRALQLSKTAVEMSEGRDASALDALAAAYAELGNYPSAITAAMTAHRQAQTTGAHSLASQILKRISLYQNGVPYREE